MKNLILMLSFVMFGFCFNVAEAQIADLSNTNGCPYYAAGTGMAKCVGCGQEFDDESGFCQAEGCPPCFQLVECCWDEDLSATVYELTIDPNGISPVTIHVINVSAVVVGNGTELYFTEI